MLGALKGRRDLKRGSPVDRVPRQGGGDAGPSDGKTNPEEGSEVHEGSTRGFGNRAEGVVREDDEGGVERLNTTVDATN